jgi:G3E family GTPase
MIIVGGFLGSGKTTVIRQLARYLVEELKHQVVIIENEVGEVGIDDKLLQMDGFSVKEIFAGCVCCQLTSELTLTVNRLNEEFNPHWIILEATGVAKPDTIRDTLTKYAKGIDLLHTIVIVDVSRWLELHEVVSTLLETQVTSANWIFLNKLDEATDQTIKDVQAQLYELNQQAKIFNIIAAEPLDPILVKEFSNLA